MFGQQLQHGRARGVHQHRTRTCHSGFSVVRVHFVNRLGIEIGLPVELAQHVDVPDDQRTLRDDARRQRTLHERLETPARQAVLPLDRLVRIGRGTDRERTLAWLTKLVTKDVGDVDAHLDVAVEVRADVPLAVARVIRPCKAVGARMDAAEEWIEAPFERHAFDGVERAFDLDLAVRGSRHRSRPRNAS